MSKKRLYVDLDGVIYNWDLKAKELLEQICWDYGTSKTLTYPSPTWDYLEKEAGPLAWDALWNSYPNLHSMFADGLVIEGALEAVRKLYHKYHITILTSRPRRAQLATTEWLAAEGIPFDSLIIVGPGIPKPEAHPIPPCYFIDDKQKNILDAMKGWKLGEDQVFLFGRKYNEGMRPSRVEGWEPILDRLL